MSSQIVESQAHIMKVGGGQATGLPFPIGDSVTKEFDSVSRPSHYVKGRVYEPGKVIEDWGLNYHLGNALKYISRAGRKTDSAEDIRKAIWYLNRRLEYEQEKREDFADLYKAGLE